VWSYRGVDMLPVTVHLPAAGSYSSALERICELEPSPPATNTKPFGNSVAVWAQRATLRLAVFVQVPELWARAESAAPLTSPTPSNPAITSA